MSYGELILPDTFTGVNKVNGRFLKGHIPHNKGKKWSDYLPKRTQNKIRRIILQNLSHRPTKRPDTAERCRRKIIGVMDNGTWLFFSHCGAAVEWMGKGCRRNLERCCLNNESKRVTYPKSKRTVNTDHRYMGIRWYFESDNVWTEKINL